MKELTGKVTKPSKLPRKITVNKVDLFDDAKIAHEFNSFLQMQGETWQVKFQIPLPLSNTL